MNDEQIARIQELSRQRWNRMVERDEQALIKSVVDAATAETKKAAGRS